MVLLISCEPFSSHLSSFEWKGPCTPGSSWLVQSTFPRCWSCCNHLSMLFLIGCEPMSRGLSQWPGTWVTGHALQHRFQPDSHRTCIGPYKYCHAEHDLQHFRSMCRFKSFPTLSPHNLSFLPLACLVPSSSCYQKGLIKGPRWKSVLVTCKCDLQMTRWVLTQGALPAITRDVLRKKLESGLHAVIIQFI